MDTGSRNSERFEEDIMGIRARMRFFWYRNSMIIWIILAGMMMIVIAGNMPTKAETTMQGPGYRYVRTVTTETPLFGPVGIIEVDGHEYVIMAGGICHKADCRGD